MSPKPDFGLLLLRVGLGAAFVAHGLPKLLGGEEKWRALGGAMRNLGIDFAPTFWGFMAMAAELGGGLAIASGLFFQPACAMLVFTMGVATASHLARGDGFAGSSHAIEAGITFAALGLIGPGRYRLSGR